MVVDALQRLIVTLQCLEQDGLALEELARQNGVGHALKNETPFGAIGASVRGAKEDDAIGRNIDTAIFGKVLGTDVVGIEQSALDEDTTEAMSDPDDGVAGATLTFAEKRQAADESLGVLVNKIITRAAVVVARVYVGVVPVNEDIGRNSSKRLWKEVLWPKDTFGAGPGKVWAAIETMNEDYVDLSAGWCIDGCSFVAGDVSTVRLQSGEAC